MDLNAKTILNFLHSHFTICKKTTITAKWLGNGTLHIGSTLLFSSSMDFSISAGLAFGTQLESQWDSNKSYFTPFGKSGLQAVSRIS